MSVTGTMPDLRPYTTNGPLPFWLPGWVISDTHFHHRRITEYEPIRETLDGDHNHVMINRWQETVSPRDVVLHLGDLMLGKAADFTAQIADSLPGRKFMLSTGNHDRQSRSWYAQNGFKLIPEFWVNYHGWRVRVTHRPDDEHEYVRFPRTLNLHGHVHSATRDDPLLINASVEVRDFRPAWFTDLLDDRISIE